MAELPVYRPHKDREARIDSAITAMQAILPLELYPAHKKELLSVCLWKISEADGKAKVRYWSEGTINNPDIKHQHEHVNERKELISRLLSGEDVYTVADDVIACMVTEEEHRALTKSDKTGWDRYKALGIKVYDSMNECWF